MNYKVMLSFTVEFQDYNADAYCQDISFSDLPKSFDADYFIDIYKQVMKRFKGYKKLMLTISGFTTNEHASFVSMIHETRFIHDSVGTNYEELKRSVANINGNSMVFRNWNPTALKEVDNDIKEIVKLVNNAQITDRQKQLATN